MEDSRVWVGLLLHRTEDISTDFGYVIMMYRAQHTKSWQELGAIMAHRGEWQRFASNIATEMGINFEIPPMPMPMPMGVIPQREKTTEDRQNPAKIVRTISGSGERPNTCITDEQIFGGMSEYVGPLPPQLDSATFE